MKKTTVLLSIWALAWAARAHAFCREPQPRLVCAEYYDSQLVVEATLIKIDPVIDKSDPEGIDAYFYTMRSDRVLRGTVQGAFRIYEGNDSGRATFDWRIGTKYLLFLFRSPVENGWSLDGCGNSSPAAQTRTALDDIDRINSSGSIGWISGKVSGETFSTPIPDVHLLIRGVAGTYKATTDQQGTFRVAVPPGGYTVESIQPPLPLEPDALSYENPRHIVIRQGGCAQVQFSESSPR